MKLNINEVPEIITRPDTWILYVMETGPFAEKAPLAWQRLHTLLTRHNLTGAACEMIGLSMDDPSVVPAAELRYQAAVSVKDHLQAPEGLSCRKLSGGRFSKFVYKGPYIHLAEAWQHAGQNFSDNGTYQPRPAECLEVYLNTPQDTAPADLQTAILIPIAD